MMLDRILADAKVRSDAAIGRGAEFQARAKDAPQARGFASALVGPKLSIIAEVKRRSPSRGILAEGLDAVEQARIYEAGGATAVSVLTEPAHFDGSLEDLVAVREAVSIPVLRKDFLLEPEQLWEARAAGADASLLIVAALDDRLLARMLAAAQEAGLDALVEVHDRAEAERAMACGAKLIGVNNRNLTTFATTLVTAEALASTVCREGIVAVAESGIHTSRDAERMAAAGYQAILVGEALVVAEDPATALGRLVGST
jgi:indole-3-glycerol phosphate synthase